MITRIYDILEYPNAPIYTYGSETDEDDMYYKELADKVRYFKEDEKGVEAMCKVMEDMRNETAKKAAEQEKLNIAQSLIKMGKLSLEEIAASVELSIDRIKELAAPKIAG